jgi:pSer/pThr/pTyr-binding forkhead associated (FHA) protein
MNILNPSDRPTLHIELTYKGCSSQLQFNLPRLRIGRRAKAQPPPEIATDDPTVSRQHAEIVWLGKNYWLVDTDSLIGTYVNGERLLKGDRCALTTGVSLGFGETRASIRVERQSNGGQYDVFLCHSGADKRQVRLIASELRKAGLNPFIDEEGLVPSTRWITELSSVLQIIGTAAVIWGPNSPGRWQMKEIEVLQKVSVEEEVRLIPVILDDVQCDPEWPIFMDLVQQIDFRKRHQSSMNQLIAAVQGAKLGGN